MSTPVHNAQHPSKTEGPNFDRLWQKKHLTPHQLLVHDVRLEEWRSNGEPRLEVRERIPTELVPHDAVVTSPSRLILASEVAGNPIERQRLTELEHEYGWMSNIRLDQVQKDVQDPDTTAKVRWMYVLIFSRLCMATHYLPAKCFGLTK